MLHGTAWPNGPRDMLDYLNCLASSGAGRSALGRAVQSLTYIERAGGVPPERQLSSRPIVKAAVEELVVVASTGGTRPIRKSPQVPVYFLAAFELEVWDASSPLYCKADVPVCTRYITFVCRRHMPFKNLCKVLALGAPSISPQLRPLCGVSFHMATWHRVVSPLWAQLSSPLQVALAREGLDTPSYCCSLFSGTGAEVSTLGLELGGKDSDGPILVRI